MWLLDTNAWIAYLNKKPSPIQSRILATPIDELRLCDVVKAELYYGAYKSLKVTENVARLTNLFTLIPLLPFDGKAAQHFGEIRTTLERQGTPIGAYDIKRAISPDTALRLSRYFGLSERCWLNLQTRYDLELQKDKLADRLEREVRIYQPTLVVKHV